MDRREFIKAVGVGAAGLGLQGCFEGLKTSSVNTPNLVIVFPDQMRAHAMGFMGEDPVITPVLDKFAGESLVLDKAVSNYPVCSPYRAMLMTGKWPHSNKVISNCTSKTAVLGCELQKNDVCWSDVLKDNGYSLGYIGKWHLDGPRKPFIKCANNSDKFAWNEWCSPDRRHGFDFWYAYGTYDYHNKPLYWDTEAGREEFHYVEQWGPEHEADTAIKFINNEGGKYRQDGKPFAMVVSMNPPHTPYSAVPKKYVDRYQDKTTEELCNRSNIPAADTKMGKSYRNSVRNYFGQVTGVDEQFGRILEAIDKAGYKDDTIVVFTSDHGNCLGIHEMITKNNWYEESMRIPFIIRWPGVIDARKDDFLLSTVDIYPTLLELMGYRKDIPKEVEGESYAEYFATGKGSKPTEQLYIWVPVGKPELGRRGIRTNEYTFVIEKFENKERQYMLYDNVSDRYQLENIAEYEPDLVVKYTSRLLKLLRKNSDPWILSG